MTRASRTRSSVWKVSDKHPGIHLSDSSSSTATIILIITTTNTTMIILICFAWSIGDSVLGYNASDSDSDELKGDS